MMVRRFGRMFGPIRCLISGFFSSFYALILVLIRVKFDYYTDSNNILKLQTIKITTDMILFTFNITNLCLQNDIEL